MFVVGRPVTGKEFVNRKAEVSEIVRLLDSCKKDQPLNLLLIGPKRIGKTSLLLYAKEEALKHRIVPVFIDCHGIFDESSFFDKILREFIDSYLNYLESPSEAIAERLRKYLADTRVKFETVQDIEWATPLLRMRLMRSGLSNYDYASGILSHIRETVQQNNTNAVLLLDEFGELLSTLPKIAATFRNILQKVPIAFIASSTSVPEVLFSLDSPLYMFARMVEVGNLSHEDTVQLIAAYCSETGYEFNKDAITKIYEFTQGHPYYIQMVAQASLTKALLDGSKVVNAKQAEEGIHDALSQIEVTMKYLFSGLSPQQRVVLEVMAVHDYGRPSEVARRMGIPSSKITSQIKRLLKKGFLILDERGVYRFSDHALKMYLRERQRLIKLL